MPSNAGPGYRHHPEYQVQIEPLVGKIELFAGGQLIGTTEQAIHVLETAHAPALYVPLNALDTPRLQASDTRTYCPFKGDASYWSVSLGGEVTADVFWEYREPFDEVSGLRGYVGVYVNRLSAVHRDGTRLA